MSVDEKVTTRTLPERLTENTMCGVLRRTCEEFPDGLAVRASDDRVRLTYRELEARMRQAIAALASGGVEQGDRIALMLPNCPEFHVVDAAAMVLGAVPFSLYNTFAPNQVADVMADAGARFALCLDGADQTLAAARRLGDGFEIVTVPPLPAGPDGAWAWVGADGAPPTDLRAAVAPAVDDTITCIYTSGSTGAPKRVEITHANVIAELRAIYRAVGVVPGDPTISYLPAAHIADRLRSHYGALMAYGQGLVTVADMADVSAVLKVVRPRHFGGVPRVWEKIRAGIEADHGADVAVRAGDDEDLASAVRRDLGLDRAEWTVTGSAATVDGQFEFFDALGIELCELWGMTETCSVTTTNRPGARKVGSVGQPLPGIEIEIDDDDEILVRAATVAAGAVEAAAEGAQDPAAAAGWLRTGDRGRLDEDGFLWLIGRKKEMAINSSGKNLYPTQIENVLKGAGSTIAYACVIADRRPYVVALLVPDPHLRATLSPAEAKVRIGRQVEAANAKLSRVEQIKRFAVLDDDWSPDGGQLTETLKLRRNVIEDRYDDEIEELYDR